MTPTEIIATARDQYNATSDTFFTDTQLLNWLWQACRELAREGQLIERVYSASTVIGQQTYSYPAQTIEIKRVTYNGRKLKRITFRDDDALTISNQASTQTGQSVYYADFNYTLYLRPIPDAVFTLQIFSFNDPQPITAGSTLEIPTQFHLDTADYLLFRMFGKDKDLSSSGFYLNLWKEHVVNAKRFKQKMKRSDAFATVQSEDLLPVTIMGEI